MRIKVLEFAAQFLQLRRTFRETRQNEGFQLLRIPVCAVALFSFCLAPSVFPQPQVATVQRDAQAIGVITQSLNAAGGLNAIAAIQDLTETGNITYFWANDQVNGTVTIKGRGLSQSRLDATLPDGPHSWIVSYPTAQEKHPDGSITPMPVLLSVKPANTVFPFLQLAIALQDPSWSISDVGVVTHNGQLAHDIRLQKVFSQSRDPLGLQSNATKTDFFVDPSTFLILSVQDRAYRRDGGPGDVPHELQFSNYQTFSGIQVPLTVIDLVGGQQTSTIQLNQVTFNSGLVDADFAL